MQHPRDIPPSGPQVAVLEPTTKRREFGTVRRLRSGRWQASYRAPSGERVPGPETFATSEEADVWLSSVRFEAGPALQMAKRRSGRRSFGSVRRLPSGQYQASYTGHDGKRFVAPATFPYKVEADLWLAAIRTDISRGQWLNPTKGTISLAELVGLYRSSEVHLRRSTRNTETYFLKKYVLPHLGQKCINEIDLEMVQEWVTKLSHSGGHQNTPLSGATVEKAGHILSKILQWAVDTRRILYNPVRGAKWPPTSPSRKWTLDPVDVRKLADAIDARFSALVLFLAFTGLRIGEALALRVGDVDLGQREVTISRRVYDLSGQLDFDRPKSEAGERIVPIPEIVTEAIVEHIVARGLTGDDALFPAPRGGHVRYSDFRQDYWNPAVEKLGLVQSDPTGKVQRFTVHQLRKTAITVWVDSGVPPETATAWAGHTDIRILYKFYKDRKAKVERAAVANVDRVLAGNRSTHDAVATVGGKKRIEI